MIPASCHLLPAGVSVRVRVRASVRGGARVAVRGAACACGLLPTWVLGVAERL